MPVPEEQQMRDMQRTVFTMIFALHRGDVASLNAMLEIGIRIP